MKPLDCWASPSEQHWPSYSGIAEPDSSTRRTFSSRSANEAHAQATGNRATNGGWTVRHGNRRSRDTPTWVFTKFPPIRGANILLDHPPKYIRSVPARGSFADGASQDTKETLRTAPSCRAPDYRRLLEQEKPRSSGRPVRCGFHPTYPGWTSSKRSARRGATLRRLCDRFPGFSFDD